MARLLVRAPQRASYLLIVAARGLASAKASAHPRASGPRQKAARGTGMAPIIPGCAESCRSSCFCYPCRRPRSRPGRSSPWISAPSAWSSLRPRASTTTMVPDGRAGRRGAGQGRGRVPGRRRQHAREPDAGVPRTAEGHGPEGFWSCSARIPRFSRASSASSISTGAWPGIRA